MRHRLVDDALLEQLARNKGDREAWLFLEPHPDFPGQWRVNSFDDDYYFFLEEVVGPYRAIPPSGLESFLEVAEQHDYQVAFFEDPGSILEPYERLNETPSVVINSGFEDTSNGFLPFQVQGFNFLKDLEAGVAMWSTGTGKTVLATGLMKYHRGLEDFDTAFVCVKSKNKVNTARKFKRFGDLDTTVIRGTKKRRRKLYDSLWEPGSIAVLGYEAFRDDHEELMPLFDGRRLFLVYDEMSNKLKNRTTLTYKGLCACLYDTVPPRVDYDKRRPSELRQLMMTATPIENAPEDFFNCVRLKDPRIYGTVKAYRSEYVLRYDWFDKHKPRDWHKLDKMGLKAAHIVHQVDKKDPDIAKQFPEEIEEEVIVEWDPKDRKLYDRLAREAAEMELSPFGKIAVLEMMCLAPTMLGDSAALFEAYSDAHLAWMEEGMNVAEEPDREGSEAAALLASVLTEELTNERHGKLDMLRYLLTEKHPEAKTCVFSSKNKSLLPILGDKLDQWGVNYVRYGGTEIQAQAAEDAFMQDPEVQVFLSSDMGSDSLDLYEGSVVIDYDLPIKWSTKIQRRNRIHRAGSKHVTNYFYTLMMENSVEERRKKIIEKKYLYHAATFKGAIADQSASARMTKQDLEYILTGEEA